MRYFRRHPVGLRFRLQLGLAVAIIALVVAVAWCGDRVEAQGALPQVTGVSASADDHDSITVSWNAVTSTCGSNTLYYEVRWDEDSGFASPQDEDFIPDTTDRYRITGLQEGATYFVQVRGVCVDLFGFYTAEGAWSAADDATPEAAPPAGQVTGVGATADDHDSITVTWSATTDADGYVVQWDTDSSFGSPSDATIGSGSTVTYRVTGLQEDTTYHVRVYATQTGVEDGTPSSARDATTTLQPPGPVTGVLPTADSDVAITVTWTAALRAGGYRMEWGTTSGTYTGSATTTSASYTVDGLTHSTIYYFRVTATRAGAADGAPSAEVSEDTEAAPTPGQVTGVDATGASDSEIEVEWDAAQHATGYIVEWDTTATFDAPDQASVIGTRAIIERLRASTEYFVRVAATRAGAANGAKSAADTATTETARLMVWADRVPGGAVGAQLGLAVFGGVFAGFRFRTMKTPRREALILLCMCGASLLLPLFGVGNLFWTGGIVLLAAASSAAVFFLASRA